MAGISGTGGSVGRRGVYVARVAVRLALISATIVAGLLATPALAAAQTDIRQDFPFEGTPGEIPVGPDLTRCGGSPDFGPFFGSTVDPFSGDTFVGFHESLGPGSPAETFSLPIDGSTTAGEDYRYGFMARIAPINVNSAGWNASDQGANSGTFRVYAGATACGLGQLVGTVNLTWPGDNQWLAQQLEFTATGAYEHLTFQATGGLSSGNATYFGIDDAVAQLQKEFSPEQVSLGETGTLNFTIENVDGLPAQAGWSFTDNLPAGVKVASPNGTTDCTNGTVTAQLDGDSVTVSGDLEAGQASCTASVEVMATEVGTHLNNHENFSDLVGISPPPPAELTCTDPPDPETEDIVGVFVDCDFSGEPPANDFTIKQDWQSLTNTIAYQTPVVGDLFGTGDPAIVVGGNRAATGGNPVSSRLANDLHVYDGASGNLLHTITTPRYSWSSFAVAAIADVDEDGRGEIIFRAASHSQTQADANAIGVPTAADVNGRLIAYKYDPGADDWDVMWVSNQRYDQGPTGGGNQARSGAGVNLADFNGDGNAEVYVGNEIFDARTGARLVAGAATDPSGCQDMTANPGCFLAQTVAVDTDGDGDLELAAGEAVYDVQITNPNGQAGNAMTIAQTADQSNPSVRDGVTAVADMDLDGAPEIVVMGFGTTATLVLYVWDPQTGAVEGLKTGAQMTGANGSAGGPPMIGDIDGDGRPEIVMVTTNRLRAFDFVPGASTLSAALSEIWTLNVSDGSGGTSMSMFDFNSDGEQEIVYRDEGNIRIIDGGPTPPNTTNRNLASFACSSGTSVDMPVIADITGTGEARIVVNCGVTNNTTGAAVRAYETNSFAWANTRPVWNQQAYFVTHINDDLTVPANQFENWTVFSDPDQRCSDGANRPLNNFQVQVTDLDSETGCPVICVPPSLEIDKTSDPSTGDAVEPGETIEYTITIENTSSDDVTDVDVTDDLTEVLDDATITSGPTVNPPGAGTAQITGNQLAFNGTIPDGETVTITYEATVNPRSELGDRMLGNSVIGEFSNCDGITGRLRCITEHPVAVPETDLELTKSADSEVVSPGGQIAYLITVVNNGPDASTGGTVTDTLPDGVTVVAFPQDDCDLQGQTLTCEVGPLAPTDAQGYQILVEAPNSPSTCFENVASVAADDDDLEPGNDEASARACTTPAADLEIEKSGEPPVVSQGGQVTYTLTVTNNGPDDATNVVITDDLPAGVTPIAPPPGCAVQGQPGNFTVTCTVGTVPSGGAVPPIEITVIAPNTPSTCFENVASVEGEEGDPDLSNNESDSVRTCTTPAAELEIEKSGPAEVDTGGQVIYTLTVTNNGPDDATNVIVTDELPAGLTPNQPPPGCNVQGQPGSFTVTCNLGTVPSGGAAPAIEITATAPSGSTCFENVASVEGEEGDPDLSNNESEPVQTCARAADVELTKTVDPPLVDPGGQVTYTLTVTNHGPDQSPGSTVTDNLPAGLTNVQVPQGCQLQDLQVTCEVGTLDADGSTDILITADAPDTPATCFTNDATVEGERDPSPGNDDASARGCTTPAADLELSKSAPATVDPAGQVSWTLTVTNHGPQQSSGSTVTDTVPSEITNIQAPGCDVQGQAVECDVGPLDADGSVDFVITGTAPNTSSTCFSNDASVEIDSDDPDESEPNPDNNGTSVETCTNEGADLGLAKTAAAGPHFAGDNVTYTLAVTNTGPATAHNVHVSDDLPASLTLVSAIPDQGQCNDQDPIDCDLGTIAPDGSAEVLVTATIASDQSGNQIENTACAEATEPDSEDADNCDTEPIDVQPEADLDVEKTATTGPYLAGDAVTYSVSVTNNGPNDATDVQLSDDLPGSLSFVSATPEQGDCNDQDPLDCELGTITSGDTVEIEIVATIGSDESGNEIENTVCAVGAETDPDDSNDCDTEPIEVEPEADLEITKTAAAGTHVAGDDVTYTLSVSNNGPNDATSVEVSDDLPNSLSFVSATPAQGQCNTFDPLDCDLGTIASGDSVEIEVVATIGSGESSSQVENTACVAGTEPDPDETNDCDTVTIVVTPPIPPKQSGGKPKLVVSKRASTDAVHAGEVLTYRIKVRNKGKADARRVRVCDLLPSGLKVLDAPGADKRGEKRVCWTLKRLRAGAKKTFKVVAQVALNATKDTLRNRAVVKSANAKRRSDVAAVRLAPTGGACPAAFKRC